MSRHDDRKAHAWLVASADERAEVEAALRPGPAEGRPVRSDDAELCLRCTALGAALALILLLAPAVFRDPPAQHAPMPQPAATCKGVTT